MNRKRLGMKPRTHVDVLTCPNTGDRVWVRFLWDGGTAYVITDERKISCPECNGEGSVDTAPQTQAATASNASGPDEKYESCPLCIGGEVDALFGQDENLADVLLWPRGADDLKGGYTV